MKIRPIKTKKIIPGKESLIEILDRYLDNFKEESVLVITSKIVSICEGSVVKISDKVDKKKLIAENSEYYVPSGYNKYDMTLTISNNLLIPTAGIDESNAAGYYILWPKDAQKTANTVREYLVKRFGVKKAGVLITDSKTTPLRWGTTGVGVAHSGFKPLRDYIQKPDIFGRKMKVTMASVIDGLAAASVLVMGEGKEQTPLAVVSEADFIEFQKRNPSKKELKDLKISLDEDIYSFILKSVKWKRGGKK